MAFKINISEKGKTYHLDLEGKTIGEKIKGDEISSELSGYELEITGASDKAGFPAFKEHEGPNLRRVLLSKGKGMSGWKKRRKKTTKVKGLRKKKTIRGNTISHEIMQINLAVRKSGSKTLEEIYPEQVKAREAKEKALKEKVEAAKNPKPVEAAAEVAPQTA